MKSPIGWNNGLRTKEILRCIYCVSTAYLCAHVYVYAHVCAFMQKPKGKKILLQHPLTHFWFCCFVSLKQEVTLNLKLIYSPRPVGR